MKRKSLSFREKVGRFGLSRKVSLGIVLLSFCSTVYGVNLNDEKISVNLKKVTLQAAISAIMQQTEYGISYNVDEIAAIRDVSIQVKNASLEEALEKCIAPYGFTFSIYNNTIIISAVKQDNKSIKGVVRDEQGEPLAGVSIIGTLKKKEVVRTVTDIDGNFYVKVPMGTKLQFSFIGFVNCTETVSSEKNMQIVMSEDRHQLDEVVVTGYQTIDRRKMTSAVTSVMMDDILAPNMTTIDQALEGRIPDLMYLQNSGEVGATARLRVRGTSTLVGNREPLWVLDGFVLQDPVDVSTEQLNDPDYINYVGNAIAGINPQDIERIDVLKDASATALYGTRAANGVIVVTTKKGKVGPPSISYSNQTKLTLRPRYSDSNINLMNSQERVQFGKDLCDLHFVFPYNMPMVGYEGAYYRYQTGQISYNDFLKEVKNYETVNTDWFDLLTNDAITQLPEVLRSNPC